MNKPTENKEPDGLPISDPNDAVAGAVSSSGDGLLRGTVEKVLYRSEENGFTVLLFRDSAAETESNEENALVGEISREPIQGTPFVAKGKWQHHARFGRQFRAFSFVEEKPSSKEAVIRYLSSGHIKGLGEVLAERLVTHFGDDTLAILDEGYLAHF